MAYDLRYEPWIPWRRRDGPVEWGPPAMLLDRLKENPVVAIAAPRPDFDGALKEFLIGLLTVALHPEDEDAWFERWNAPPTADELRAKLDALPPAFDLEGEGPRFLQDLSAQDFADVKCTPVEQLLIDGPGEQTVRLNKDLFTKRNRIERLGRPAAAMALLTLQTYAPSGGQGHRTSLRGGGPLTTLIDPRVDAHDEWRAHEQPLWKMLWANVETVEQWHARTPQPPVGEPGRVFPWLAPTRVSDAKGGSPTTPQDAHPLQAYFGMPRRIRLELAESGRCDLTGIDDACTVTGFRMTNYGVQYTAWRHPLTPYYRAKATGEWLPMHGQPGGVGWRDWLGLTLRVPEAAVREPAAVVAAFNGRGHRIGAPVVRLHAFGYDLENMKPRAWTDAAFPAFADVDRDRQRLLIDAATRLTNAAGIASTALFDAVKRALFDGRQDVSGDLTQIKGDLWSATEAPFFDVMRRVASPDSTIDVVDDLCRGFARTLSSSATALFDRWCAVDGLGADSVRRLVGARFNLVMTLTGHSKLGKKLFETLGITAPGAARSAPAARSRPRKEGRT